MFIGSKEVLQSNPLNGSLQDWPKIEPISGLNHSPAYFTMKVLRWDGSKPEPISGDPLSGLDCGVDPRKPTGWHIRLWWTSRWLQNKSSILACPGLSWPCQAKMELLFQSQREVCHNLMCHPVCQHHTIWNYLFQNSPLLPHKMNGHYINLQLPGPSCGVNDGDRCDPPALPPRGLPCPKFHEDSQKPGSRSVIKHIPPAVPPKRSSLTRSELALHSDQARYLKNTFTFYLRHSH